MAYSHCTVLLESALDAMLAPGFGRATPEMAAPPRGGIYVDGTFGRGGHARGLLARLDADARLLVLDRDPQAIAAARALGADDARVTPVHDRFGNLGRVLMQQQMAQVNGILLDLGVSSPQLDDAARGFSFMRDGPLDMRMDTSEGETAAEWLAHADEQQIREVIADYGEERFAFRIAKAIVACRESGALRTTGELAELVARVVPTREKGQHPATRTFQAIRIHVNGELRELAGALAAALSSLCPGGRLVVISFHSLEDRMVKQCFAAAARPGQALARQPIAEKDMPRPYLHLLGRVRASAEEIRRNPRARSAVLRAAARTEVALSLEQAARLVPGVHPGTPGRGHSRRARSLR